MSVFVLEIIKYAYGFVGIIGFIAYLPTIKDLYLHKKPSANMHSYALWTLSTFIATLYSNFVLDDFLFRLVSSLNFLACSVTLTLAILLRKQSR